VGKDKSGPRNGEKEMSIGCAQYYLTPLSEDEMRQCDHVTKTQLILTSSNRNEIVAAPVRPPSIYGKKQRRQGQVQPNHLSFQEAEQRVSEGGI